MLYRDGKLPSIADVVKDTGMKLDSFLKKLQDLHKFIGIVF